MVNQYSKCILIAPCSSLLIPIQCLGLIIECTGHLVDLTKKELSVVITLLCWRLKPVKCCFIITGVEIISHGETSGLGANAATGSTGEAFRGQFVGLSGTLAVTKDGGTIDALTGATVTSRAMTNGVSAALACAATLEGGAK